MPALVYLLASLSARPDTEFMLMAEHAFREGLTRRRLPFPRGLTRSRQVPSADWRPDPEYKLIHVTKLYRKGRRTVPAVSGPNLTVSDGEWLAVQGRTGHGKSSLLNLLGSLYRPTQGTVEFDGTSLGALRETQLTRLRAESAGGYVRSTGMLGPDTREPHALKGSFPSSERQREAETGIEPVYRALQALA
jgi:ABC-type glutathione transport system ATPase component